MFFRFEALDLLKKKSTLIITLALSVIVLGVALLPMILVEDEVSPISMSINNSLRAPIIWVRWMNHLGRC